MAKNPDFAKYTVPYESDKAKRDGGKPLQCSIAGATHFACLDVAPLHGSFKPGQRAAHIILGKGDYIVSLTVIHDKRPNLDVAKELAEKIFKQLP